MIDSSPATNASGSSSAIEARELPVEPALELGIERRPAVLRRDCLGNWPAPAPTPDQDRDHHGAGEEPYERQEPRQPVEALTRRRRQNRRAELRDELVLDLPFGDTRVCSCLDEALDVARDRRVRLVER